MREYLANVYNVKTVIIFCSSVYTCDSQPFLLIEVFINILTLTLFYELLSSQIRKMQNYLFCYKP